MSWIPDALEQLSHIAEALLYIQQVTTGAHALQQEKLLQREARAPQLESSRRSLQLKKKHLHSKEDPAQSKVNKTKIINK